MKEKNKNSNFFSMLAEKKEAIALILILLLASFFRLWQIDSIPPGIYPDEAVNATNAVLEPGRIFYKDNNGREGFYINLIGLSFKLFGISRFSLKAISISCGILTVFGVYLMAKELFERSRIIPLLSAFFLAISFWPVNFSRIAFRANMVPFLLTFSFYFLFKGLKSGLKEEKNGKKDKKDKKNWKRFLNFAFGGLFFGLGFHTYISFRFAVLILLPVLVGWLFVYWQKRRLKDFLIFSSIYLFITFLVALPIGIYFLKNPGDFLSRSGSISVFSQKEPLKALVRSLAAHLAIFNIYGDANWRHNISRSPILFWPTGILFILGIFFSLFQLLKSLRKRDWLIFLNYFLLLSWWFVMLLPAILTYESIPHALRIIGAIPPTFIFAGLGGYLIFKRARGLIKVQLTPFMIGFISFYLFLFFSSFVLAEYFRYFELWAKNKETEGAFAKNSVEVGNFLNSLPEETTKYVIVNQNGVLVNGVSMPAQTPMFIETTKFGKQRATYLNPATMSLREITTAKETVIIPLQFDNQLFVDLLNLFPEGTVEKSSNNLWFFKIYKF